MAFVAPILPSLIASLAVAAAATVAATLLTPHAHAPISDNSPTVLTERGSPIPLLLGRRRVNGFLCWAGERTTSGGGGGGGKGGGGGGAVVSDPASGKTPLVVSDGTHWLYTDGSTAL